MYLLNYSINMHNNYKLYIQYAHKILKNSINNEVLNIKLVLFIFRI